MTSGQPQASGPATRVAVIDCGTNSIRLLIAQQDRPGRLVDVDRRLEIVRLGQGVDASGRLHPDALARTFAAVERYAEVIRRADVPPERVRFVATSAARDAGNRDTLDHGVRDRLGVDPRVLSGDAEARLTFAGALSRLDPVAEPVLVMDIGGGSTELVLGTSAGQIHQAVSLDIGSVRLTERFLRGSPPAAGDVAAATRYVDRTLAGSGIDLAAVAGWIGVAGTVTTMAAVHLGLAGDDPRLVHGRTLPRSAIGALAARLVSLPVADIRAVPAMHPQRADVIAAGTLIAARVAQLVAAPELVVSVADILDGIALDLLGGDRTA